mmetsp:Transcript_60867/g.100699  ORF Transcript_60867/g.100699 Transcript_60867/m.100699 type:complete len:236 (+) Transcript_60867:3782-4489(+)
MPTVCGSCMHHDREQQVVILRVIRVKAMARSLAIWGKHNPWLHRYLVVKLISGVDFDLHLGCKIEFKPLQVDKQHGWKFLELCAFVCRLLAMTLSVILVVTIQSLGQNFLVHRFVDIGTISYTDVHLIKRLVAGAFIRHVAALDVCPHLPLEEFVKHALRLRALHFLLKIITQQPHELLDVMLLESLLLIPTKRLGEFFGLDGFIAKLHFTKQALQRECYAPLWGLGRAGTGTSG